MNLNNNNNNNNNNYNNINNNKISKIDNTDLEVLMNKFLSKKYKLIEKNMVFVIICMVIMLIII